MVNAPHAARGPAKAGTNHQGESPRCLKGRGWKTAVEGRSCSWQTKWPWFQRCPSAPRGDRIPQGTGCSGFAPSIPQAAGAQTARRWAWAGRGRDHAPAPLGPCGTGFFTGANAPSAGNVSAGPWGRSPPTMLFRPVSTGFRVSVRSHQPAGARNAFCLDCGLRR